MLSNPYRRPISTVIRGCAGAASVIVLLTVSASLAEASPAPDPVTPTTSARNCPLTRVGTQFVRCDNLTGAGVRAPQWVPELPSGRATHKLDPC
jgi:hypothetical protein